MCQKGAPFWLPIQPYKLWGKLMVIGRIKWQTEDNLTVKSFKYIMSWYRAANRGRNKLPVFNDTKASFSWRITISASSNSQLLGRRFCLFGNFVYFRLQCFHLVLLPDRKGLFLSCYHHSCYVRVFFLWIFAFRYYQTRSHCLCRFSGIFSWSNP